MGGMVAESFGRVTSSGLVCVMATQLTLQTYQASMLNPFFCFFSIVEENP